jgi:hypothetical protein
MMGPGSQGNYPAFQRLGERMRFTRSSIVALLAVVSSVALGCETETAGTGTGGVGGFAGTGGLLPGTGGNKPRDAAAEADAAGGGDAASVDVVGESSATVDASPDVSADAIVDVTSDRDDAMLDVSADANGADVSAEADAAGGPDTAAESQPIESSIDAAPDAGTPEASNDAISDAADSAVPGAKVCGRQCAGNGDCPPVGLSQFICNTAVQRCVTCLSDSTCIAQQSGWLGIACTTDAGCAPFGDYCVDVDGSGRCAFDASKIGTFDCFGTSDTFAIKKFATNDVVTVCASVTQTCDTARGTCITPCTTGCTAERGGMTCNATTGHCECASNADCGGTAPNCNLTIHQCECGSTADCPAGDAGTQICN